ncbi:DNA primase, large subunit [Methanosalsum zhilinae DSM 4017]|uniref:DNA primase large subunit PriL n=1 Tax=Methanosalsum zhilinae (strain DSM 4017 / NBRC 107636 / OCM 62 / WeN5) TaxID=679901 RepID=F7XM58_METZD|nr:DNA primase regulatory subunit PriL [Methanosalsum zhilinae]AEH61512.1 DNA primase, large subunit [Methanosalsum zhilinae DSM 4017]
MDKNNLALYPFISPASEYVNELGLSVDRLMESRALESARLRGRDRVLQALDGKIEKPSPDSLDDSSLVIELLSYPFARILVSCIKDEFLIRRYALKEAEASFLLLNSQNSDFLLEFAREFDIAAEFNSAGFILHFTDYIRLASTMKDLEWKLVNRKLKRGFVPLSHRELARLLQEAVRSRIQQSLPADVPEDMCQACEQYLPEIREALDERKQHYGAAGITGEVDTDSFPPCINYAISQVRSGANLAHSMRFAMTSFLLNVGMSVDEVVNVFNVSPDFDAEKTRYQIEHIAGSTGTMYKPPSCSTMKTYGNCYGADNICESISHPLGYYERKKWILNKNRNVQDK